MGKSRIKAAALNFIQGRTAIDGQLNLYHYQGLKLQATKDRFQAPS